MNDIAVDDDSVDDFRSGPEVVERLEQSVDLGQDSWFQHGERDYDVARPAARRFSPSRQRPDDDRLVHG